MSSSGPAPATEAWVALSGGVDSAVAAAVALERRLKVTAVTMQMGTDKAADTDTIEHARAVADYLGIPHVVVDARSRFHREVVDPFCEEYLSGRTPNPCILCNEALKFGLLGDMAEAAGASCLVTGHYARVLDRGQGPILARGCDTTKDQSYFLYRLKGEALRRSWFPLGEMTKSDVRAYASSLGLPTAERSDSQDVCFLNRGRVREFVGQHTGRNVPGSIVDTDGRVLREHDGIAGFTVGQRKGLGVASREPLYVLRIEANGTVVVGPREACMRSSIVASSVVTQAILAPRRVTAQYRYRTAPADATLRWIGDSIEIVLDEPVCGIAPGQSVVCYDDDVVVVGGYISEVR